MSSSDYRPVDFPNSNPRMAVFWADVDTRPGNGGFVWYRTSTNSTLLQQALRDIQRAYPSAGDLDYLLIATWDHVGYFSFGTDLVYMHMKYLLATLERVSNVKQLKHICNIILQTNTFQCVLARGGAQSYAIYLYADGLIQWPQSGLALAGYNAGDGTTSYTIPGSFTTEILNISLTSNVDVPGMWIFQFNEELTPCADISLSKPT